jgi:hypothetical protein
VWQETGEGDERRESLYERGPLKSAVWSFAWPMRDLDASWAVAVRVRGCPLRARERK